MLNLDSLSPTRHCLNAIGNAITAAEFVLVCSTYATVRIIPMSDRSTNGENVLHYVYDDDGDLGISLPNPRLVASDALASYGKRSPSLASMLWFEPPALFRMLGEAMWDGISDERFIDVAGVRVSGNALLIFIMVEDNKDYEELIDDYGSLVGSVMSPAINDADESLVLLTHEYVRAVNCYFEILNTEFRELIRTRSDVIKVEYAAFTCASAFKLLVPRFTQLETNVRRLLDDEAKRNSKRDLSPHRRKTRGVKDG